MRRSTRSSASISIRDIAPVAAIAHSPNVMLVESDRFRPRRFPSFIALAKANPGKISMASAGVGTASHLSGELFKMMTGVNMVHVPYRGGARRVCRSARRRGGRLLPCPGLLDWLHQGRPAARIGGDHRIALGRAAEHPDHGRIRAGLRGQHLVWHRRAQEHARRNRRQAQPGDQCELRRSQGQGADCRISAVPHRRLACRLRQADRRRNREVGQGDPVGRQHRNSAGNALAPAARCALHLPRQVRRQMEEQSVERSVGAVALKRSNAGRLARPARMARAGRGERPAQAHRRSRSIPTRSSRPSPIWRRGARTRRRCCSRTSTATRSGARVLANMLGASKERYALAVGLDPVAVDRRDDLGDAATIMQRRIKPGARAESTTRRSTRSCCATTRSISRNFPAPKFWPGDGGRYIGTGNITLTRNPDTGRINVGCYRQMLHGPRRVGLYCSPGKHGLHRSRRLVGARQAVRGGRGLRHRSGAVHAGGAGVRRQGIRARRRRRHDGPRASN